LPPDMRDWLPEDHLVWFVIDVVGQLDVSGFGRTARLGGVGRRPWDPQMLLTLLVYGYAHGVLSSRRIERLCATDVAFRVICGNDAPDHTSIARFRAAHGDRFAELFTQVLVVCARSGLGRFGAVAIDGTKIAANASKRANRTEAALRAEAERLLGEAAAVDAAEDEEFGDRRGDELPDQVRDPRSRLATIRKALDELAAEQAAEAEANRANARVECWRRRVTAAEQRLTEAVTAADQRWAAARSGSPGPGRPAVPADQHVTVRERQRNLAGLRRKLATAEAKAERAPQRRAATVANLTDPESRLVKSPDGFIQGFNAQLAVTDDHLIAAVAVTTDSPDTPSFLPMMAAAVHAAAVVSDATAEPTRVGMILADAGYLSDANLTAPGPDRLIAVDTRRHTDRAARRDPATGPPPGQATPKEAMRHRLRDPDQLQLYRRRAVTVEPVIGMLKDRTGLRRFPRRGRRGALSELHLAAATLNLLKLYAATAAR
jgi:transposase